MVNTTADDLYSDAGFSNQFRLLAFRMAHLFTKCFTVNPAYGLLIAGLEKPNIRAAQKTRRATQSDKTLENPTTALPFRFVLTSFRSTSMGGIHADSRDFETPKQ